jgi:hypothetical protein
MAFFLFEKINKSIYLLHLFRFPMIRFLKVCMRLSSSYHHFLSTIFRQAGFVLVLLFFATHAYSQLAVGQWQTHYSYRNVSQVAVASDKVYAVGSNALFSISLADQSIDFYSLLSGKRNRTELADKS